MPYSPLYISETLVEGQTQIDIGASTRPTTTQVLVWIEEIETGIVERALGSHTATDEYWDVPAQPVSAETYEPVYHVKTERLTIDGEGGLIVPLINAKKPIISITSLAKNDEALDDAPDWETLVEGPAAGSEFVLLKSGTKALTYALFIYDNTPLPGPKRLKATYQYGWNVSSAILQEYCTLGVSIKVLEARRGTSQADGLTELTGDLGTYIPAQYESRINQWKSRMVDIEQKHFQRRRNLAVAIIK